MSRTLHFGDLTLLHKEDAVCASNQGGSMRHDDAGDWHFRDEICNRRFSLFIKISGAFVEKEDTRLAVERPRYARRKK